MAPEIEDGLVVMWTELFAFITEKVKSWWATRFALCVT
jgi:hypothetical protein